MMKKFVKNFWSLNVDEALVANWLKQKEILGENYEVFFPINSQLAYVDLIVFNKNNQKTITIQVKSSQSYEVKYQDEKYWASGHKFDYNKINSKKVDFFIFTCFYPKTSNKEQKSRDIIDHYVVFTTEELQKYVKKYKNIKKANTAKVGFSFYIYPPDIKGKLYEDMELKEEFRKDDYAKLEPIHNVLDNFSKIKKRLE